MEKKEHAPIISEILEGLGKAIDDLKTAFFHQNKRSLKQAEKDYKALLRASLPVVEEILGKKENTATEKQLLTALPMLQKIGIAIDDLLDAVEGKLVTGTGFSEKSLSEVAEVMGLVKDLIRDSNDALATGKENLKTYVSEGARHASTTIDNYELDHDRRLAAGLCTARASFLYLDIMLSLKRIAQELALFSEKV